MRAVLPASRVAALALLTLASTTWAAPTTDQNTGVWTDLYQDNAGVASGIPETFGIRHDPFGRLVTLADNAPQACRQEPCLANEAPGRYGQLATLPIAPVSFDGWKRAYLKFNASQLADVEFRFMADNGTIYGPFTLLESDDPAFSQMVNLQEAGKAVPASVGSGRLLFHMRERVVIQGVVDTSPDRPQNDPPDVRIRPTLQGLRATWTPRSVVRVAVEAPTSTCSNNNYTVRVRVAVSLVRAENLVVWSPLTTPVADQFGLTYPLQFRGASNNGQYAAANTVVGGVTVPANSVYWNMGPVDAGNTFVVSYNVAPPTGARNGTTYSATAEARASNAAPSVAPAAVATATQSSPAPIVRKSVSTAYLINNRFYTDGGRTLGYNLFVANHEIPPSTCTENYYRAVVYDNVSDLVQPATGNFGSVYTGVGAAAFTISDGGVYTENGTTVQGVTIPPRSIYWDLGTMGVGARRNLSVSVNLKQDSGAGGPLPRDHRIFNTAHVRSGAQAPLSDSSAEVYIGIPNTPSGQYAKGDKIRGSAGISAGNDNWQLSVGYGDPITFLMYARNAGASQLANTVFVDKIPADTTFSSAFLPSNPGGTVYYHVGGADNALDQPPDFTVSTGVFGPSWTTVAPANPATVRWVGFSVPRLASSYFPVRVNPNDDNSPLLATAATAEVTVTVNQPQNGCPLLTVNNRGLFQSYGYVGVGQTVVTPITGIAGFVQNDEPVQVKPLVPSFEFMSVGASPSALINSGNVTFFVNVPNRLSGGVETDTALNAAVTIVMPRMSLNGVTTYVPFVSATAPGGNVDLAGLPNTITVRYPSIAPDQSAGINVTVNVPSGFVSGQSIGLSATATANDDVCGPISASSGRSVVVTGNPYLTVAKRATLGVAARGSEIEYVLSYTNIGDAVSTRTWIVDKVPPFAELTWASEVANGGQVWFSNKGAPLLPATMRAETPVWTDALVRQNFVLGEEDGDGRVYPPNNFGTPTWVAFLVDNNNLDPAQFPSSGLSTVRWGVEVSDDADVGDIIRNEAAIFSSELLTAISNETATIVSDDPSLDVLRVCPEVVASGEDVTYRFQWVNNSTNEDYDVRFVEQLPSQVDFVGSVHTWNAASSRFDGIEVEADPDPMASTVTWDVSDAIDPSGDTAIESFEGGELAVTVHIDPTTPSGTFLDLGGLALATDFTRELSLSLATGCRVLVENSDLFVRLAISETQPVSGETVGYTVVISNEGANIANNTVVKVTLPVGVTFVAGSPVLVTTPGWTLQGTGAPNITTVNGRQVLTWSVATNNALVRSGNPAGRFPGRSGDVNIAFSARVGTTVLPETTLTANADVTTVSGEDTNYPNSATATAVTPLPDPWVIKSGPSFAQPGDAITYRLRYGNQSRQATGGILIVDKLYDSPPTDGLADVTLVGLTANSGEVVYYHDAPLTGAEPAFNANNPAQSGWRTAVGTQAVNWVGFYRPSLNGNAGPFSIFVDVALRAPGTGREPQAGASIPNIASVKMTDPGVRDQDPEDNTSTVITRTPGVDIAADLICTPEGAFPGGIPGQDATVTLELKNNGTVTAYGLKLAWAPGEWFEVVSDDASEVAVETTSGAASNAVDENNAPVTGRLLWSKQGNNWVLGDTNAASPTWYRKVGIPAGHRVRITVQGKVAQALVSGTVVDHDMTVTTDYRFDFDPQAGEVEEIVDNNTSNCTTTIFRADPMVLKTAEGVDKDEPFTVGDRIEYSIAFNNIGAAPADGVFIEDYLPEDVAFVAGSLTNLPEGTTVRYDDGSGSYGYTPVGGAGTADPNVRGFRVTFDGQMPAPAGATFRQDRKEEFDTGTFEGTAISPDGDRVIVSGRGGGNRGAYVTPVIPTDETASVVEWGRIVVKSLVEAEGAGVTVSVLDADSGETIAQGLVPDASGAVDVQVDAAVHQRIRLRADMVGSGLECSADNGLIMPIELEYTQPPSAYSYGCVDEDTALGYIQNQGSSSQATAVAWTKSESGITAVPLPKFGHYDFAYQSLSDGVIVGETYDQAYDIGSLAAWKKVNGNWTRMQIPEPILPENVEDTQVNVWDSEEIYGFYAETDEEDGVIGAFYRDQAGEWVYSELPPIAGRDCESPRGRGKTLILRCYNDQVGEWRPVEYRPDQPAESSLRWIEVPPGASDNGDSLAYFNEGQFAQQFYYPNLGTRLPIFYEYQDTQWVSQPLTIDVEQVREVYVRFFLDTTHAYGQAHFLTEQGWRWGSAEFIRQGNTWTVNRIPLPAGYNYGVNVLESYTNYRTLAGEVITPFYRQRPDGAYYWSTYLFWRDATGPHSVELEYDLPGADQLYGESPSSLGWLLAQAYFPAEGRWSYVTFKPEVSPTGQRTYRALTDASGSQNRWHQGPNWNMSSSSLERWASCEVGFLNSNTFLYYYDESMIEGDTYSPVAVSYPADTIFTSRGSIDGGMNGAFFGYNSHDTNNFAVLFLPDGDYGLRAVTLDKHPDALNESHGARWVSPDHKHVLGYTYIRNAQGGFNIPLLWTRDAQGHYGVTTLAGAGHPDSRGYIYDDASAGQVRYTRAGARGQSGRPDGGEITGLWFYTPDKPNPFVWVTPHLPGIANPSQSIQVREGGVDFAVVQYARKEGDVAFSEVVIIERDPTTELGLRFTPLPREQSTRDVYVTGGNEGLSEYVYGWAYVGNNSEGFLWRREEGQWQAYRLPKAYNSPRLTSRTTHGALGLPLVYGDFPQSVAIPRNTVQDGVAYQAAVFPDLDGASFVPWAFGGYQTWPNETSIGKHGLVLGAYRAEGRWIHAMQVIQEDLTFEPTVLPGIEDDDNEELRVDFAAPGPILYGRSFFGGRDEVLVAWWFPEGDLTDPQVVNLNAFVGLDESTSPPQVPDCWYDTYNFARTDDDGFARTAFTCDFNRKGNNFVVVDPGPDGIQAVVTEFSTDGGSPYTSPDSLAVPVFYGNSPRVIGCTRGGGVAIDSTQVLFRTDVNPSFQYRVEVPDVCQTEVSNTAAIFTSSPQVTAANDRSEVVSGIETVDLEVDAQADRGTVEVGDSINYTLSVTNRGPGAAANVRLEAFLPDGAGGPTPRIIRRNLGTLAAGQTLNFEEEVEVTTEEPFLPLNATASVTTSSIECDTVDNSETVTVLTGSLPNVTVALDGPPTWAVGETAVYEVMVVNNGNSTSSDITLTVNLPQEGEVDDIDYDDEGGEGPNCSVVGYTLTCEISSLTPVDREGSPFFVSVTMRNPVCDAAGENRAVDALVTASLDANVSDNTARMTTSIVSPTGRFTVSGVPSRSTVEAGDDLTLFFLYTNTGTAGVDDAALEALIPTGTTFKAEGTTPGYEVTGNVVRWSLPTVPAGRGGRIALALTASGNAPMNLTSRVDMRLGEEANACPVGADVDAGQITAPGLHITKRASASAGCGEPVQWLITVTNTSNTTRSNLVVTDTVPAQSPYITGSIAGPGASAAGNPVLSWTIGSLAPGRAVTLGFRSQPPASSGALVSNIARVESGGQTVAQSAPAVVWATCNGGALRIAKSWDAGCVVNGQTVNVQVSATNTTPQALSMVTVTDALPQGVVFVASTTGATYEVASGHVVQVFPSIAAGQTVNVRYTATVSGASGDLVLDAAVAVGGGVQPQASNPVTSVVQDCNDNNPCTVDACVLFVGCVNTLTPIPGIADNECNGVDDNCNGLVDDGWVVTPTTCGQGVCASTGQLTCPAGATEPRDTCNAPNPSVTVDSSCNGLDDDCDGPVDEEYSGSTVACGDVCAGSVQTQCVQGRERWDCAEAAQSADGASCDDGDACSDQSTCGGGVCRPRRFISCSDDNTCTRDTCDAALGCVYEPLSEVACDDNNLCTDDDMCVEGTCTGSTIACPEGNECQAEGVCNPATGVCDYTTLPGDHPVPIALEALPALSGFTASAANDLNANGAVVGWAENAAGQRHAVLWQNGTVVDLTPTAVTAEARHIDGAGLVVGTSKANASPMTSVFGHRGSLVTLFSGNVVTVAAPGGGVVAGTADGALYISVGGQAAATAIALPTGAVSPVVHQVGSGGHVVGRFEIGGLLRAFRWHAGTLTTLADAESEAVAVNASGDAVGWVRDGAGNMVAHRFASDGTSASLGTLDGDESYAVAINDGGLVVGNAMTAAGQWHGVTWTGATAARDLGTLGLSSDARLVSASGFVAGTSTNGFGVATTVLWLPDGTLYATDLEGATSSRPVALNDAGLIAGVLVTPVGERAFVWDLVRGTEDLGTLGGFTATPNAMDEAGRVVGTSTDRSGTTVAFMTGLPETTCVICDSDTEAPVIHCPQTPMPLECVDGMASATLGRPSVSDACGRPVETTNDAPESYPLGATLVTWTSTDSEGNQASCSSTVVVEDSQAPAMSCPESIALIAPEGACSVSHVIPVTADDACDGAVDVLGPNGSIAEPVTFGPGTTNVTLTALDAAGHQTSCVVPVEVTVSNTLVIACDPELIVEAPADFCGYPEALAADVLDGCGSTLEVTTASESFPLGMTDVTFEAENAVGQTSTCTTLLTVVDVTPPVLDCGVGGSLRRLPTAFAPTAQDACGVEVTITNPRCLVTDGANTVEVSDGCGLTVREGSIAVDEVPVFLDGDAIGPDEIRVAWRLVATDPSGNTSTLECESALDLFDRDRDRDGIVDLDDNCPDTANTDQLDSDFDGVGDVCDDSDADGLSAQGSGGCQGGGLPVSLLVALGAILLGSRRLRRA